MAAKKRDYKAEYQRRKDLAQKAGYKSEAEYKKARKAAQRWSREYSRKPASRYTPRMTAEQVARYNRAFTENTQHTVRLRNERERHTIEWLHHWNADVYPDESDVEYWDRYFSESG